MWRNVRTTLSTIAMDCGVWEPFVQELKWIQFYQHINNAQQSYLHWLKLAFWIHTRLATHSNVCATDKIISNSNIRFHSVSSKTFVQTHAYTSITLNWTKFSFGSFRFEFGFGFVMFGYVLKTATERKSKNTHIHVCIYTLYNIHIIQRMHKIRNYILHTIQTQFFILVWGPK